MSEQESAAPEQEAAQGAVQTPEAQTAEENNGQPLENGQTPDGSEAEAPKPEGEKTKSQERRERRKAEIQRLREREAAAQERLDAIKAAAKGVTEPIRENFDDPDEYIAAKAAFSAAATIHQNDVQRAANEVQESAAQKQKEAAADWMEQVADAKTRYTDFEAVAYNPNAVYSDAMTQAVTSAENGAEVAYFLGSNPQQAARISQLDPVSAAIEIGRLSATVSAPQPKTETSAPPPITPVRTTSSAPQGPNDLSPQEYRRLREAGEI